MESATSHPATLTRSVSLARARLAPWVAVLALLQAALLVPLAAILNTWTDEEYTLASTAHGVTVALSKALTFELQAPLYFGILAVWRSMDGSVFFARLFSVLCALALTFAVAALAKRLHFSRPSLLVLVIALSPFTTYAALEARLYAFALLLSTLVFIVFCEGFLDGRRWAQVAFVVLSLAAIYTQYYEATLLIGCGCALLVARREALRAYLVACAVIAAGLIPIVQLLRGQVQQAERYYGGWLAVGRLVARTVSDFLLPHVWDTSSATHLFYRALQVILVLAIAFARPRLDRERLAAVALALGSAIAFVVLGSITQTRFDVPRHLVALFVPVLVAGYAVVSSARGRSGPMVAGFVLAIFSLSAIASLAVRYEAFANTGDWKRVAAYLEPRTHEGDVIVVFDGDAALPLSRYYQGSARIIGIPHGYSLEHYASRNFIVTSQSEVAAPLAHAIAGAKHVWLVTDAACQPRPNPLYGCRYLDAVLARNYVALNDENFFESRVREIRPAASSP